MNKATQIILRKLTKEEYGRFIIVGIGRCSKVWDKLKERKFPPWNHADPKPLVKYLIRTRFLFGKSRTTLSDLQNSKDNYNATKFLKFAGNFSFDKDLGGFVPMYYELEGSIWLKKFYDAKRDEQIQFVWRNAQSFLTSPNGDSAILIHKFDKPHVYFMQDIETEEIKIGVSKHPEIRRKQLISEKGNHIEILHIIPSGGTAEESRLHKQFRTYRTHGEWFSPDTKLIGLIDELKS